MKIYSVILFLTFLSIHVYGQEASDVKQGIRVQPSEANDKEFLYGEPFYIHLEIENLRSEINYIYSLASGINARAWVKDIGRNIIIHDRENLWEDDLLASTRAAWKDEKPSPDNAFAPKQVFTNRINVIERFGNDLAVNKSRIAEPNSLTKKLYFLQPEKYTLYFEYYLFPSDKKILYEYNFTICKLSAEEEKEFNAFVESLLYTGENSIYFKNNYDADHPRSIENFLKTFPFSIYSDYAVLTLSDEVVRFGNHSEKMRIDGLNLFFERYESIKRSNVKFNYAFQMPANAKQYSALKNDKSAVEMMNDFLLKASDDAKSISDSAIKISEKHYQIKGLKNYTKE